MRLQIMARSPLRSLFHPATARISRFPSSPNHAQLPRRKRQIGLQSSLCRHTRTSASGGFPCSAPTLQSRKSP
ncbi:unnamed protein product [Linum tenue]|uniref:Uncharacterized protein n=1 Tax=Linum tenue TaxID=586396 RepID=A0AAV0JG52_9ROSI|nr:unnamed protein product [Linum tenue]